MDGKKSVCFVCLCVRTQQKKKKKKCAKYTNQSHFATRKIFVYVCLCRFVLKACMQIVECLHILSFCLRDFHIIHNR